MVKFYDTRFAQYYELKVYISFEKNYKTYRREWGGSNIEAKEVAATTAKATTRATTTTTSATTTTASTLIATITSATLATTQAST